MKRAVSHLSTGSLLLLAALLRGLPTRARVAVGRRVGDLVWALGAGRRRLALGNLRRALGLPDAEARRVAREAFRHFGRVGAECLALPAYAAPRARALFEVEGLEHLRKAHELGRGVIVFSAHYGNWELVAQQQALAGFPMDFIAQPLSNRGLDRALVRWRETVGNRVLGKRGALKHAVRTLRDGRSLAILIDQNVRKPPRLFVPFLGRPASVTPALGSLAARRECPVVPVVSYPRRSGGYLIRYLPALGASSVHDDPDARARALTMEATRVIESWIREKPEYWLWLHDRWKAQPRADETPLGESS